MQEQRDNPTRTETGEQPDELLPADGALQPDETMADEQITGVHARAERPERSDRPDAYSPPAEAAEAAVAPDALTIEDMPSPPPARPSPARPPAAPAAWAPHRGDEPRRYPPRVAPPRPPLPPRGAAPPRITPPPMPSHVPWQVATSWGPTTLTIDANTLAGVSYLFWWVSGVLIYFNERHNRYVRFHAIQSILLTAALTVWAVVAYIVWAFFQDLNRVTHWQALGAIGNVIGGLTALCVVAIWFWAMVSAWTGNYLHFPYIGTYAERYAAPPQRPTIPPA